MNDDDVKKDPEQVTAEDEARIAVMSDEDIDYSDIPPIRDWTGAVRGRFYRPLMIQQSALRNNSGHAQEVKEGGTSRKFRKAGECD